MGDEQRQESAGSSDSERGYLIQSGPGLNDHVRTVVRQGLRAC